MCHCKQDIICRCVYKQAKANSPTFHVTLLSKALFLNLLPTATVGAQGLHTHLICFQTHFAIPWVCTISGVPRNFVRGGGSTNSVEDRERGSGGSSPLVRGSGGSCNLVQEISFYRVTFFNFWSLRLFMMTTNLFVIVNVKQLRTEVVLEFYCLFSKHFGVLAS